MIFVKLTSTFKATLNLIIETLSSVEDVDLNFYIGLFQDTFLLYFFGKKWAISLNNRASIDFQLSDQKKKGRYITKRYKNPCTGTDKSVILIKQDETFGTTVHLETTVKLRTRAVRCGHDLSCLRFAFDLTSRLIV